VDINSGMNRTGIPMNETDNIIQVAKKAELNKRFKGIHWYEGHIHEEDLNERQRIAYEGYNRLMEIFNEIQKNGVSVPEVITSGTPGFLCALSYPNFKKLSSGTIHRVSPGTVVFHDIRTHIENPSLAKVLQPAALLLSRVLSHPTPGLVTLDCGSKSVASEVKAPVAMILGHPELTAQSPSEEHLPLSYTKNSKYVPPKRGSPLLLFPFHVCPTVNLAESAVIVDKDSNNQISWNIVPVAARAHEISIQSKL